MYKFTLYLSVRSPGSVRAIKNLRTALKENLKAQYSLKTINLLDHPKFSQKGNIFITPTLVKVSPPPVRKVVGDLSSVENASATLDLVTQEN